MLVIGFLIYRYVFGADRVRKNIQKEYQNIVLKKMTAFMGEGWSFSQQHYLPKKALNNCLVFGNTIDKYDGQWLIKGKLAGKTISISPIHAEREDPFSGPKKRYLDVFKGYMIAVELDSEFEGNTMLLPQSFWNDSDKKYEKLPEHIDLPAELTKNYAAFTDNAFEGRAVFDQELLTQVSELVEDKKRQVLIQTAGKNIFLAVVEKEKLLHVSVAKTVTHFDTANNFYRALQNWVSLAEKVR